MLARVPGSTANLGPGFDTLALAVNCYLEVEITPADSFALTATGEGGALFHDQNHPGAALAIRLLGNDKFNMRIHSEIPLARGLGSSAALAAAVAAACDVPDPFRVAADFDGHPENAAASVFGGLVTAAQLPHGAVVRRLPVDNALSLVVVVPRTELITETARKALPDTVPFSDAVFNLSRMGLLVAGLADLSQLTPAATEDRLHQQYRAELYPAADAAIHALVEAGALAAAWSGAGPSTIGFCAHDQQESVVADTASTLRDLGVGADVLALAPDVAGLTVKS